MTVLLEKLDTALSNEMEAVDLCPVCGSADAKLLFWNCDRLYHLPGKFGTYSCSGCGLIRLSPRPTPTSINKYYPEDYGAYLDPSFSIDLVKNREAKSVRNWIRQCVLSGMGYGNDESSRAEYLTSRFLKLLFYKQATYGYGDRFPAFVSGATALEVGCGNAAYLSYLKFHGWKVEGLDLSTHAARAAKDNFDIDVHVGQLEQAPFSDAQFDYIHLSHVVEHFYDPLQSMKRVYDLLKPGGRIYVEVPNADGRGARTSGEFWYGWDAPRHLFMFTPDTLEATLSKAGFSVSKMTSVDVDSLAWETTYRREAITGEKERQRPSTAETTWSGMTRRKIVASLRHLILPLSGDFISCWASKPGA